jgi:rod shape-determining protein MreC
MIGSEKGRNRRILVILLVVSFLVMTVYSREGDSGIIHRLQRLSMDAVSPLQRGVVRLVKPVKDGLRNISDLGGAAAERDRLKEENDRLKEELLEMERLRRKNEELKSIISYAESHKDWQLLAADVIGSNSDNWKDTRQISAGYDDGVEKYMAVLDQQGNLVGRVTECTAHTSLVLLVTDKQCSFGAKLESNGEAGLVRGEGDGSIRLELINQDAEVYRDDLVVTSGMGGTCPPGIKIGTVREISELRTDLSRGIIIDPLAGITRLERVVVVLSPPPSQAPVRLQE